MGHLFEGGDEKEEEEEEAEEELWDDDGQQAPEPEEAVIMMTQQKSQIQKPQKHRRQKQQEVISKSTASACLDLRVVYGSQPPTPAEARILSAHMRWPRGRAPGFFLTNKLFQSLGDLWVCSPTSPCALPR